MILKQTIIVDFITEDNYIVKTKIPGQEEPGEEVDKDELPRNVIRMIIDQFRKHYPLEYPSKIVEYYPSSSMPLYEIEIRYNKDTYTAYIHDWLESEAEREDDQGFHSMASNIRKYIECRDSYIEEYGTGNAFVYITCDDIKIMTQIEYKNKEFGYEKCQILNIGREITLERWRRY